MNTVEDLGMSERITGIDAGMGKEKSVQRMFSSIAKYYDINNTLLSLGLHHCWKKKAVSMLGASRGDILLDLCSGTGDIARFLSKVVQEEGHVVAADLNMEMLQVGTGRAAYGDNLSFMRCNAELTAFRDDCFNGVTVAFGMRNLSDMLQGFREIRRVLKKGGRLVCLEFSTPVSPPLRLVYGIYSVVLPHVGRFVSGDKTDVYRYLPESIRAFPTQEKLKEIIEEAGFSRVRYENLSGGIVAIHTGIA